ncbi:mitochondrial enolase superfamily member 1-like [Branchiostoma floridae x Branchiostoma belcheri]
MATITALKAYDLRFPTSLEAHGSDAMHTDPDYSCGYVVITTDAGDGLEGHGLTFTCGRGTEVVVVAIQSLSFLLVGKKLEDIYGNFSGFWRALTSESQMRWIGPEKGVIHLATAAIVNALWDLWAKREGKPLWKLLVDMEPEKLVSCIDFRYISDVLTKEEAVEMLKKNQESKADREKEMLEKGYPAYITSAGWLGYSEDEIRRRCREGLAQGWTRFKVKVGADLADDVRRCGLIREEIGWDNTMMVDANQRWDVQESIDHMKRLAEFKPLWIEEPTSPDDALGHATIAKALNPLGIGVATGEQCQNRVIFKQMLQAGGLQFCQIDSCRMGGVNEVVSVILMAAKFGVPVCPHAGGVGLCQMVQHLAVFDYISVSASLDNRVCEFADHLHENFKEAIVIKNASYVLPKAEGYSTEMKPESIRDYQYPNGAVWQQLFKEGKFTAP